MWPACGPAWFLRAQTARLHCKLAVSALLQAIDAISIQRRFHSYVHLGTCAHEWVAAGYLPVPCPARLLPLHGRFAPQQQ
jgi:hypothetical protein